MPWETSQALYIWIFNVGRGSAAFVRTPLNQGFILDIARSDQFSASNFIIENLYEKLTPYKKNRIAQAVISHPHYDHFSDCDELLPDGMLHPTLITCPSDKEPGHEVDWLRIKNRDANKSLPKYRALYHKRQAGLQTIEHESRIRPVHDLEYGIYYVQPDVCDDLHGVDNEYGNSLSIVTYLRYGANSIVFPGDITPAAMAKILGETEGVEKRFTIFSAAKQNENPRWTKETWNQPSLKSRLGTYGLSVLVAPHHGLESCYSPELYAAIKGSKPEIVAISEVHNPGENQGKIHRNYQSAEGASGLHVRTGGTAVFSRSVTTKSNHILIKFNGSGAPRVYSERRIEDLMDWANQ